MTTPTTGLGYSGLTGRLAENSTATSRWRLLFIGVWLLYLIQPTGDLVDKHHNPWYLAGAFALLGTFCAIFLALMIWRTARWSLWGVVALTALAILGCVWLGGAGWNALWIYVSASCGLLIEDRKLATRAVFASGGCFVLFSWIGHDQVTDFLITLLPVVVVGLAMIGLRTRMMLMRELTVAREEVEQLAAREERLRLARDMHDLTGQSLSMITLKSELAVKLLDAGDNSKTREQLEEVAAISRQTLHDIREAVSGYRRPTLAVEAITARTTLTAAGIEVSDDPKLITTSGTLDPDAEAALAWCLREAVTNVVRHSSARHCDISLSLNDGELVLTITDDGRGFADNSAGGNGLRGISERLTAVGGQLSLTGSPGFTLSASVPGTSRTRSALRSAGALAYGGDPGTAGRGPGDDQGSAGRTAVLRGRYRDRRAGWAG
jgi:two-component system, NarL family, sensor histidine kinase DesK